MTALNREVASIYSHGKWIRGTIHHDRGVVTAVEGEVLSDRPSAPYIVPAFVDLHVHGGNGADAMNGAADVHSLARFHARFGTGALCATTLTAPADQVTAALRGISDAMSTPADDEAEVLGAHIEGPFINPEKLGGQPPFAIHPDLELAELWTRTAKVLIVTLAPELPGSEAVIRFLCGQGAQVQIGHSLATADEVAQAVAWGAKGFAHLFNAVAPITARHPGVTGWALANATWSELICDLKHVDPALLRHAIASIPKAYFITDCCAAAGRPDGEYRLGLNSVTKADGLVCLTGTKQLAASLLVGSDAFQNILSLGCSLETAVWMTSTRPSQYVGAVGYGDIVAGKVASVVALDDQFNLVQVWLRGREIDL
ncbi:amidohydrolase family protein [Mesorhizobium sp. M0047]|uniref:N-acetylglucosamine-6-phosphate deacetylase n=1 Tax=Mesorhizobium sp. M0047 TaxID=2956859 RepID=UPI00333DBC1A